MSSHECSHAVIQSYAKQVRNFEFFGSRYTNTNTNKIKGSVRAPSGFSLNIYDSESTDGVPATTPSHHFIIRRRRKGRVIIDLIDREKMNCDPSLLFFFFFSISVVYMNDTLHND